MAELDAVVIGSGPNGLTAAATIAAAGRSVARVRSGADGGRWRPHRRADRARLPPRHVLGDPPDGCPLTGVPALDLQQHGLRWIQPAAPLAHPLDSHTVVLERSVDDTAAGLDRRRRGVAGDDEPARGAGRRSDGRRDGAVCASRAIRSSMSDSPATACAAPSASPAAASTRTAHERCSPDSLPTRCCRSTDRSPAGSACCSVPSATPPGGRSPPVARRRSSTPSCDR